MICRTVDRVSSFRPKELSLRKEAAKELKDRMVLHCYDNHPLGREIAMTRTLWFTYLLFVLAGAGLFWWGEMAYTRHARKIPIAVIHPSGIFSCGDLCAVLHSPQDILR